MRLLQFSKIKALYKDYYKRFYVRGEVPIKDTKLGMWGVSASEDVFVVFQKLAVSGRLLDLGSGDGKVVMIASLFCDSVAGVECDSELVGVSNDFADKLGIAAEFIEGDYMTVDLSLYDWLYLNPDHDLVELEGKLLRELKGKVIVHSNLHQFKKLKVEKEFDVSGVKLVVYSN